MRNSLAITLLLISILMSSCFEIPNKFTQLPPGKWRAVLKLDHAPKVLASQNESDLEVVDALKTTGELPFNFDIAYDANGEMLIHIINGDERIAVEDFHFGRDPKTAKDTIRLDFPIYESYIEGIFEENVIEGNWVVTSKKNYAIPFIAYHGQTHRFDKIEGATSQNLSGKWDVTFEAGTDDEYPAVGEFEQKGTILTGTFMTETGDYRFLEGIVDGDKFWLSCFDGSHAFLFEGRVNTDGTLLGTFRSGRHYTSTWVATKNDNASLVSALELTKKTTDASIDFSFINTNGKMISLTDKEYEGKAKLVKIMGTWCPNCLDEMNFLLDYQKSEKPDDLEIIAVAFERYKDTTKALNVLERYKQKKDVPFEILYGGYLNKGIASKAFPMIDTVMSYPTLLFIDKENKIQQINTGFSGPATSKFADFKKDFYRLVDEIRK